MKQDVDIEGEPTGSPEDIEWIKTFTSWKLDLINCMAIDPRLQPSDVRLAIILLRHLNSETGQCNPSEESLALQMSANEKTIHNCKKRLKEAGWLSWKRSQNSNWYSFSDHNVNAMLDRLTSLQDAQREHRQKQSRIRNQLRIGNDDTGNRLRVPTRNVLRIESRNGLRTNTLKEHLKRTPEDSTGIEREAPKKPPYVPPSFDHLEKKKDESK